jgi:gamma-tubulin complex component 2
MERAEGKRPSPQPSAGGTAHKRVPSGSQRTGRPVEERRTERVQVTTRETITSRTRSPERRPASSIALDRSRPTEGIRINSGDPGHKSIKVETPQGAG